MLSLPRPLAIFAAVALLPATALHAQQVPAAWPAFVRTFDAGMDSDHVVGGAVVLVSDGRIVARHERGFGDRALGQRIDAHTLFHYGSITKTLTAIAIMQLRDRGRLSLDDHITRWVPELRRMHDPYGMMDSVTLRMLLSHSAGFQNPTWPYTTGAPWEPFEPTTWQQLVAMMPYQELHFRPGSRYSYSNPGFLYLARVIEAISGDPWETYVQKNIFAPLGLDSSYFGATPYYLAADRSNNYTLERDSTGHDTLVTHGREFDPGITIPNGGWNAPLGDLARYVAFLTDATHGDAALQARYDVVLKRSSLEEMWRALLPTSGYAPAPWVGLSFFMNERVAGPTRVIGHTGSQAGFVSFMYFNPTTRMGVVGVFNTLDDRMDSDHTGFTMVRDAAIELMR